MEVPPGHKVIQEGKARILYPSDEDGDVPVSFSLFSLLALLALFQTERPVCVWVCVIRFILTTIKSGWGLKLIWIWRIGAIF